MVSHEVCLFARVFHCYLLIFMIVLLYVQQNLSGKVQFLVLSVLPSLLRDRVSVFFIKPLGSANNVGGLSSVFSPQEVIDLTQELISGKSGTAASSSGDGANAEASTASEATNEEPAYTWKVGDQCMAVYSEDGM